MIRSVFPLFFILALGQSGCRGCNDNPNLPLLADAAPAPPLAKSNLPPPKEFESNAHWEKAMDEGDEIDFATLADTEGASGLLEAMEHGGKVGRTALAALPFAPDAPVAYQRLAQLALLTKGEVQLEIIRCIHEIAQQPQRFGEAIDDGGKEDCVQALEHIAKDPSADKDNRAFAVSTLRLPTFENIKPAELPSDFDTPSPANCTSSPPAPAPSP